jgi:hypothetical protein
MQSAVTRDLSPSHAGRSSVINMLCTRIVERSIRSSRGAAPPKLRLPIDAGWCTAKCAAKYFEQWTNYDDSEGMSRLARLR